MVNKELCKWQEKYETALTAYEGRRTGFKNQQEQYEGRRRHEGKEKSKAPKVLWNFTKELIESQIDSNVPMPKVEATSTDEKRKSRAAIIEAAVKSELKRLNFIELNDQDERTTKIMGGNFLLTEWDNFVTTKDTVGAVRQKLIDPLQFIPQEGVTSIDDMDYIFLTFEETKERIKARYGKDVEDESVDPQTGEVTEANETVTQVICFYKNKRAGLGCFSWVGDTVLIDDQNYNARGEMICARCGLTKPLGVNVCKCGSRRWEKRGLENEELDRDVATGFGEVIPSMVWARDENGEFAVEDYEQQAVDPFTGLPVFDRQFDDQMNLMGETPVMETLQRNYMVPNEIPYYVPKKYPVAVRKNISVQGWFLGDSDCETIWNLQDSANKVLSKLDKKSINTGSILTKPEDLQFTLSNDDLQTLNLNNPGQIDMIRAISLEFDVSQGLTLVESYYQKAKSVLGITDSYQGKEDRTAMSGKAKEIQVMQSGGRLTSKREMKNYFYTQIFESIFQYLLAYSDEPRTYKATDDTGHEIEQIFNRYDFLDEDEYGNWHYDDDFIFGIDETGSMFDNKETQLEDVRTDYGLGAYGDPNDPETKLQYWKIKETLKYPNAKQMTAFWEEKVKQAQMMQQQIAIQQQIAQQAMMNPAGMPPGGGMNEMPPMQ